MTKLVEAVLKSRRKPILNELKNPLQRGFIENATPIYCALIVEVLDSHNKHINKPTYVAFLDAKSVFDVVVHPNLMRKLYNSGIKYHKWLPIKSLHESSKTSVKWQGLFSPTFTNRLGVPQGGVLSADLYKLYNNEPLNRI